MNNNVGNKSFVSALFSPAVSLAILGTVAFVFSFYRAGQLANLALPKDFVKPEKSKPPETTAVPVVPKLDVNSQDLITLIDTSNPAKLVNAGDNKKAMAEALVTLTNNSPSDVANIAVAGDIYSAVGNKEDKELGLALLSKAMTLAPKNQYLAYRYVQRMAAAGQLEQAAQQLTELVKSHSPLAASIHLILAKIFWLQGNSEQSVNELLPIKDGEHLSAEEQKEAALMFVKVGRILDGYMLFRQAMSGRPEARFYAAYCGDSLRPTVDDYKTALAVVDANLSNDPHPNQLTLEIKHAVLLLLLDHNKEAKDALEESISKHKDNTDLQILLAAAHFAAGDSDQALDSLELAAKNYQPKL